MGKAFTEEENKKNIKRLKEEGRKLASQNGFKNTSIDELVKRCGIAKGQFYRYYETKELFFLEVRNEVVKEVHEIIALGFQKQPLTKEIIVDNFCELFKIIKKPEYKVFFDYDEIQYLFRKLPKNKVNEDFINDSMVVDSIVAMVTQSVHFLEKDRNVLTGIIRSIFLINNNIEIIGEEFMEDIMKYHIESMVNFVHNKINEYKRKDEFK